MLIIITMIITIIMISKAYNVPAMWENSVWRNKFLEGPVSNLSFKSKLIEKVRF